MMFSEAIEYFFDKEPLRLGVTLMLVAVVLFLVAGKLGEEPMYSNMTREYAGEQVHRSNSLNVEACYQAGGRWVVTFTQAYCTVEYEQPDRTDWFIQPEVNPRYDTARFWMITLIIIAIVAEVFGLLQIVFWFIDRPHMNVEWS